MYRYTVGSTERNLTHERKQITMISVEDSQLLTLADSTSLPGRVVTTLPHCEIKPQLCDEFFDETE